MLTEDQSPMSQEDWLKHVLAWEQTTLSQLKYCKEHDINYKRFNHYVRKQQVSTKSKVEENAANFIPIKLEAPLADNSSAMVAFKCTTKKGATLEWSAPWSPEEVAGFIHHCEGYL